MDQLFRLLTVAGENPLSDQRSLAALCDVSVGKVNALLHLAQEDGYLTAVREGKKSRFTLTPKGKAFLEQTLLARQGQKLPLKPLSGPVKTAVILAAGKMGDLEEPVALLPLEEEGVLERMLKLLENSGIERFVVVAGYQAQKLRQKLGGRQNVVIVENDRHKWTGTMASLAAAREKLDGGFLVLKGNLVFEQRAVSALLADSSPFAVLLAGLSGTGEETFVELDELGDIFRFAKDIRQVNRIQGEFAGIAKVSPEVLELMMAHYDRNQNPLLNFEYLLENIGRLYRFKGVMVDDLVWGQIWDRESYQKVMAQVVPRILRKEREIRERLALSAVEEILGVPQKEIDELSLAGGITNINYLVKAGGKKYILRLPGRMTESMISRENEKRNAEIASQRGFNCNLIYCNAQTGIKLSEYIEGAETLTPRTVRLEENLLKTARILRSLHQSDIRWENRFDPFVEAKKYESLLADPVGQMYDGYSALRLKVEALLKTRLLALGVDPRPCHNDLVAANLVKDYKGRLYLIDWEYSGENDPMFDVAALFLENDFTPEDEELFFHYYYGEEPEPAACREKILIYKIVQDYLWSVWTVLKESRGDNFGSYGQDRFTRAQQNMALWEKSL